MKSKIALIPLLLPIVCLVSCNILQPDEHQSDEDTLNSPGITYFVGPDGDDSNSGTRNNPWLTIDKSSSKLQPGDTLWKISRRYNTTVDALIEANPDIDPNNLHIGQKICIPKGIVDPKG